MRRSLWGGTEIISAKDSHTRINSLGFAGPILFSFLVLARFIGGMVLFMINVTATAVMVMIHHSR